MTKTIVLKDYATNDSNLQLDKNVNPLNIDQTSVNLIEQNNICLVNDEIQINMKEQNDVHVIQESNSNSNNFEISALTFVKANPISAKKKIKSSHQNFQLQQY